MKIEIDAKTGKGTAKWSPDDPLNELETAALNAVDFTDAIDAEILEDLKLVLPTFTKDEVLAASEKYFNGDKLAANVFLKYALRSDPETFHEDTPDKMHRRLAKEFARIEAKYPNAMQEDEIYNLLKGYKQIVAQGGPMFGIGNNLQTISLSNCFTLPPPVDSYGGICKTDQELVQIAKRRGGIGFDLSNLRPAGMPTKNAALTSTGIGPFMDRYSNSTREVGQSGRRGALLQSLSIHHPDIITFLKKKRNKELCRGANISPRFTDEFMNAVVAGEKYQQRFPVDEKENPQIEKWVDAREIWNIFIESAWFCAEPGALFWDTVQRETPSECYELTKAVGVNPCAELILGMYGSCRLLLVNLYDLVKNKFTDKAHFDFKKFAELTIKAQRLMDDLVDLEIEKIEKILAKIDSDPEPEDVKAIERNIWKNVIHVARQARRTGLGITGLGDAIAALGVRYGSDESIEIVEEIYKTLAVNSYRSSITLAKERGAFPMFSLKKEQGHPFLDRILAELTPQELEDYMVFGRRNVANTTTAPVGSGSTQTQTTSGIENAPFILMDRNRKLDENEPDSEVDWVDESGDRWKTFRVFHKGFQDWMDVTGKTDYEESPYFNATIKDVDWVASAKLQGVAQKWVCHSISKTCNLPEEATQEVISDAFMMAWRTGCKGFTVYREGSRNAVLEDATKEKKSKDGGFIQMDAPKRPSMMRCDAHVMPKNQTALIGLLEEKPYEVMIVPSETLAGCDLKKPIFLEKCKVFKTRETRYDLHAFFKEKGFDESQKRSLTEFQREFILPNETRMISLGLRHGAKPSFIVEQLQKTTKDFFADSKNIARVLKKYILDGEKVSGDKSCPECGEDGMIYMEGCSSCLNCGYSKCS